jgi:hypothetical protein
MSHMLVYNNNNNNNNNDMNQSSFYHNHHQYKAPFAPLTLLKTIPPPLTHHHNPFTTPLAFYQHQNQNQHYFHQHHPHYHNNNFHYYLHQYQQNHFNNLQQHHQNNHNNFYYFNNAPPPPPPPLPLPLHSQITMTAINTNISSNHNIKINEENNQIHYYTPSDEINECQSLPPPQRQGHKRRRRHQHHLHHQTSSSEFDEKNVKKFKPNPLASLSTKTFAQNHRTLSLPQLESLPTPSKKKKASYNTTTTNNNNKSFLKVKQIAISKQRMPPMPPMQTSLKRSQRCRNLFLNDKLKKCHSTESSTTSLPLTLNTSVTLNNNNNTMCVLDKNASITYLGVYEANPVEYRKKHEGNLFNIMPNEKNAYNSEEDNTDTDTDTTVWYDDEVNEEEKLMHLIFKLFDIQNQERISFRDVKSVFEMLNRRYERGYTYEDAFVFFYSLFNGENDDNVSVNDESTISYEQFRRGFLENFL